MGAGAQAGLPRVWAFAAGFVVTLGVIVAAVRMGWCPAGWKCAAGKTLEDGVGWSSAAVAVQGSGMVDGLGLEEIVHLLERMRVDPRFSEGLMQGKLEEWGRVEKMLSSRVKEIETAQLLGKLDQHAAEFASMVSGRKQRHDKYQEKLDALDQCGRRLASVSTVYQRQRQKIHDVQEELRSLSRDLQTAQDAQGKHVKDMAALQRDMDNLAQTEALSKNEITVLERETFSYQENVRSQQAVIAALALKKAEAEARYDEFLKDSQSTDERVNSVAQELSGYREVVAEIEMSRATVGRRIAQLETQIKCINDVGNEFLRMIYSEQGTGKSYSLQHAVQRQLRIVEDLGCENVISTESSLQKHDNHESDEVRLNKYKRRMEQLALDEAQRKLELWRALEMELAPSGEPVDEAAFRAHVESKKSQIEAQLDVAQEEMANEERQLREAHVQLEKIEKRAQALQEKTVAKASTQHEVLLKKAVEDAATDHRLAINLLNNLQANLNKRAADLAAKKREVQVPGQQSSQTQQKFELVRHQMQQGAREVEMLKLKTREQRERIATWLAVLHDAEERYSNTSRSFDVLRREVREERERNNADDEAIRKHLVQLGAILQHHREFHVNDVMDA